MGVDSIRAIIFDVGGVLLRSGDRIARRKWEARLGLRDGELSRLIFGSEVAQLAMLGQASEDDVWRAVGDHLKLDEAQLRDLRTDFWSDEELNVELARFMRVLRLKYKVAILSNAFNNARRALVEKFGLEQTVDLMVISGEEGLKKPDARIYQLTLQRLNVLPAQAVFVDDGLENVQAARALGMRGIQFIDTAQAMIEVKKYLEE